MKKIKTLLIIALILINSLFFVGNIMADDATVHWKTYVLTYGDTVEGVHYCPYLYNPVEKCAAAL